MKKLLLFLFAFSLTTFAFAKKVKFSVDLSDEPSVDPNGVHVMGDFQKLAGYAEDWAPDLTMLTKEGNTNIYSITVNIPAGRHYEYKYINGKEGYQAEFIPFKSRFIDPDVDNRWFYLDSLDSGITDIGAVKFKGNAPAGKLLLRFKVNMLKQFPLDLSNKNNIPHVEGSFQGWSATATAMFAPNDTIFEYMAFVTAGTYEFKYINGNAVAKEETVPSACATSGKRTVTISVDSVLNPVCFSSCLNCGGSVGIKEQARTSKIDVFPNPSSDYTTLKFTDGDFNHTVTLTDITGKVVRTYDNYNKVELRIDKDELNAGIYFISSQDSQKNLSTSKWIVQ